MREKTVLMTLAIVTLMLLMLVSVPVKAWEYYNTSIYSPQTDNLTENFGPRADMVQITLYADELAEFTALEMGKLDVTDWPVDEAHYVPWRDAPLNASIAVVDTGPEFGMFLLDIRMNNETRLYYQVGADVGADVGPNPAYTAPFGNPMADIWLRRAVASCIDRKYVVESIVSGGKLPLLGAPLYTVVNDPPYTGYGHPELNPAGALKELTYAKGDGSADIALGNKFLDEHGYTMVAGVRTKGGVAFTIDLVIREDHTYRKLFGEDLYKKLTDAPPAGLGLSVNLLRMLSAGARVEFMDKKKHHMYTGGWGLTIDPDHLYYLFHINNYYHPGRPLNYAYYPGDYAQITVPYNGWQYNYTNVPGLKVPVDWASSYDIDLSDYFKTWNAGDKVWKNPQNYWSSEMMIAPTPERAINCSRKSQEAMAYYVVGSPVWASRSFTAFSRTYTGPETAYHGKPWKGVVNEKGLGVWSWWSFYNMHTSGDTFGDGTMTIRWGFRQPTMSLNPVYAEWVWDWYVLNKAYLTALTTDPYVPAIDVSMLASSWDVDTWDASGLGLGICSKFTFHLRHDMHWSDGVPITASDFVFTWGNRLVPGSISNILYTRKLPMPYWYGSIADMISIAAPDPWTVIVYLDVFAPVFGLHSMTGFNYVLPEHIWKPIASTGDPTAPFNQPAVGSGPWNIRSTASVKVGDSIWLDRNEKFFQYRNPINIWTKQESKNTLGNAHWLVLPETNITVNVTVYIHNKYVYETGPKKENVFPQTELDGTKNVTLWKWTGAGCPNDQESYVLNRTLATNVRWAANRSQVITEKYTGLVLSPGWYYVKVDLHIDSCRYFDGTTWITVPPAANPFYCTKITYKEFMIVTLRVDFGGLLFKPCPPATPKYERIPDLIVDIEDIYTAALAYGAMPGHERWSPAADINVDFIVDIEDIYSIALAYGWTP